MILARRRVSIKHVSQDENGGWRLRRGSQGVAQQTHLSLCDKERKVLLLLETLIHV